MGGWKRPHVAARRVAGALTEAGKYSAMNRMMRQHTMQFQEADTDGNAELDFEEWRTMLPEVTVRTRHDDELREWFDLIDKDGSGAIGWDEFFKWAFSLSASATGMGLMAVFKQYDKDASGFIDEIEFTRAARDLGMGDVADQIFQQLTTGREKLEFNYTIMMHQMRVDAMSDEMRNFMLAVMLDMRNSERIGTDTSTWKLEGTDAESLRLEIVDKLVQQRMKRSQLFNAMDLNGSMDLQPEEFADAMINKLGFAGDRRLLLKVFSKIDGDGTGHIGFDELTAWLDGKLTAAAQGAKLARGMTFNGTIPTSEEDEIRASASAKSAVLKKAALVARGASIAEGISKKLVEEKALHGEEGLLNAVWDVERLRLLFVEAIRSSGAKIIDILEAWDESGDGVLSRKEFVRSTKSLLLRGEVGVVLDYDASTLEQADLQERLTPLEKLWYARVRDATTDAFKVIDASGDGTINISEMCRWLDPSGKLLRHVNANEDETEALAAAARPRPLGLSKTKSFGRTARGLRNIHGVVLQPHSSPSSPSSPASPSLVQKFGRAARGIKSMQGAMAHSRSSQIAPHAQPSPIPTHQSRHTPWLEVMLRELQVADTACSHASTPESARQLSCAKSAPRHSSPSHSSPPASPTSPGAHNVSPIWRQSPVRSPSGSPTKRAAHRAPPVRVSPYAKLLEPPAARHRPPPPPCSFGWQSRLSTERAKISVLTERTAEATVLEWCKTLAAGENMG